MDKPQRQMNVGFLSFRYITKTTNKGQEMKGKRNFWGNFVLKKIFFFFNDIHVTFGPEGIQYIHISYTHGLKRRKKEAWLFSLHILKRSSASPPNDKGTLFKCGQLSFEVTT